MRPGLLLVASLLAVAAPAAAAEAPVTLPGGPLSVSVGPLGQCQSSYASSGNDFYPPAGALGDCGFLLAFPESGNPAFVQKKVFGFEGSRGPRVDAQLTPLSQGVVRGDGSASSPYTLTTRFVVSDPTNATEGAYALVEETTSYVEGAAQFSSTFDVENVTGQSIAGLGTAPAAPLRFHAIYAGDLSSGGDPLAGGVLIAAPPRLLGGENPLSGTLGGFLEAPAPSPPWSSWAVGCSTAPPQSEGRCPATSIADGGIWAAVGDAARETPVFDDDVDPSQLDLGAGVSWDDHLRSPLKPGEHATYSIVNRADVPAPLHVTPGTQTRTVGQTATVTVTATDSAGAPYAGRPIVYTVGDANPKLGSVLTDGAGVATISYVGTVVGPDTMHVFLDLAGSGELAGRDPSAAAQIAWTTAPASANSRFALHGVRVARDGTVAAVLVPRQQGTASVQVSAPTAAVALNAAHGTRARRCNAGQIRLRGMCFPRSTVTGKAGAEGHAGVTLRLVVTPSRGVRLALASGRSVHFAVKLVYTSALGGKPTVERFALTVKPAPRKARARKRR